MNSQQPSRPAITPAMREQAAQQPNSWLYVVDPIFTDPKAEVPPWGFIGGFRVDANGELTDDFSPNPNYRPSPVALRLPAPSNDLERALQLTTTGYAQGQSLLAALLEAELIMFAQPQGNGLFTLQQESGRKQLQVFTSEMYLPQNWTSWQRMTGRALAELRPMGVDLQVNPQSSTKAKIPCEDLIKAAGLSMNSGASMGSSSDKAIPPNQVPTERVTVVRESPSITSATTDSPRIEGAESESTQFVATVDPSETDLGDRFVGSMLAMAAADALGAEVEFYPIEQIRSRYGEQGIVDYDRAGEHAGAFTDDTQMTLFTTEGLIRGHLGVRQAVCTSPLASVQLALQRWLHTQGYSWQRAAGPFLADHPEPDGWLVEQSGLFSARSPGSSGISALRAFAAEGVPGTFRHSLNASDSNGGIVRATPVALWSEDPKEVFELAAATAALTYSEPDGYLPVGVHAVFVQGLLYGKRPAEALSRARALLADYAGHENTERSLAAAVSLAERKPVGPELLKDTLGGGWSGPEALAIAVCALLSTDTLADSVLLSVNHSGDSDSTGAICGALAGALYGKSALPGVWLRDLCQSDVVETLARDALHEFGSTPPEDDDWTHRYPTDVSSLDFASAVPGVGETPPSRQARDSAAESSTVVVDGDEARVREAVSEPSRESEYLEAEENSREMDDPDTNEAEDEQAAGVTRSLPADETEPDAETDTPTANDVEGSTTARQESTDTEELSNGSDDEQPDARATTASRAEVEAPLTDSQSGESDPTTSAQPGSGTDGETREPITPAPNPDSNSPTWADRVAGCLLGGAVGDALGYAIEFDSLTTIRTKFGPSGLTDFIDAHRPGGSVSDDTQMTLFTLDGLIRASIRHRLYGESEPGVQVQYAYQRWLHTQGFDWKDAGGPIATSPPDGWLIEQRGLFVRRAPGATCVKALHGFAGGGKAASLSRPLNDSKGCGAVMRAAPVGLWSQDCGEVFRTGALTGVLTHGHPSGFLPAGVLAVLIQQLLNEVPIRDGLDRAMAELSAWDDNQETAACLHRAIELASSQPPSAELIERELGGGWVGEEALAIAVYSALCHPESLVDAIVLAANHSGDSDSTAAICGNIMGAALSRAAIPTAWLNRLELRETIETLARDAIMEFGGHPSDAPEWLARYPFTFEAHGAPSPQGPSDADTANERGQGAAEHAVNEAADTEWARSPASVTLEPYDVRADAQADPSAGPSDDPLPEPSDGVPGTVEEIGDDAHTAPEVDAPEPSPTEDDSTDADSHQVDEQHQVDEHETRIGESETGVDDAPAEPDSYSIALSEEENRLLAAWRHLQNGSDLPHDVAAGLRSLLVEAIGPEEAARVLGETSASDGDAVAEAIEETPIELDHGERLAGCVLGGAAGDGLGAPWILRDAESIRRETESGPTEFAEVFGVTGSATAITQQMYFLLRGMILAEVRERTGEVGLHRASVVRPVLRQWLHTQGMPFESSVPQAELPAELFAQRLPDSAGITALCGGDDAPPTPRTPPNAASDHAATTRGALAGLFAPSPDSAVTLGVELAVLTHGAPDGYLPAGALAGMVNALSLGHTLASSVHLVIAELDKYEGSEHTSTSLRAASRMAHTSTVDADALETLGTGWQAPAALAIAVAAALSHPESMTGAMSLAASHSGHSAATTAICGALLGTSRGARAVPQRWVDGLELREPLQSLLLDYERTRHEEFTAETTPDWANTYLPT